MVVRHDVRTVLLEAGRIFLEERPSHTHGSDVKPGVNSGDKDERPFCQHTQKLTCALN